MLHDPKFSAKYASILRWGFSIHAISRAFRRRAVRRGGEDAHADADKSRRAASPLWAALSGRRAVVAEGSGKHSAFGRELLKPCGKIDAARLNEQDRQAAKAFVAYLQSYGLRG